MITNSIWFFAQGLLDVLSKVNPQRNVVDVHEDGIIAEVPSNAVTNASSDGIGVFAAIGNGNLRHGQLVGSLGQKGGKALSRMHSAAGPIDPSNDLLQESAECRQWS